MQKKIDYAEAIKSKYPEQLVIAIARDAAGKANPVTIGWTMIASGTPPMMAVALAHKRYSTEAVRHSKCFTIAYPTAEMAEETMLFGTKSGWETDKLDIAKTPIQPAAIIDSVLLRDAVANFECTLESETAAGDHIIFVGKIVASHVNTEKKKRLYTIGPNYKLGSVTID